MTANPGGLCPGCLRTNCRERSHRERPRDWDRRPEDPPAEEIDAEAARQRALRAFKPHVKRRTRQSTVTDRDRLRGNGSGKRRKT